MGPIGFKMCIFAWKLNNTNKFNILRFLCEKFGLDKAVNSFLPKCT